MSSNKSSVTNIGPVVSEYGKVTVTVCTENTSFSRGRFLISCCRESTYIRIFISCPENTPIKIMAMTIWTNSLEFTHVKCITISGLFMNCRRSSNSQNCFTVMWNTILVIWEFKSSAGFDFFGQFISWNQILTDCLIGTFWQFEFDAGNTFWIGFDNVWHSIDCNLHFSVLCRFTILLEKSCFKGMLFILQHFHAWSLDWRILHYHFSISFISCQ